MTDQNHIAEARKKVSRPQIREVFLRNGFTIKPDRDDLADHVYEAAFELTELAVSAAIKRQNGLLLHQNALLIRALNKCFIAARIACPSMVLEPWQVLQFADHLESSLIEARHKPLKRRRER